MRKKNIFSEQGIHLKLAWLWVLHWLAITAAVPITSSAAVVLNANPVTVKRLFYNPYHLVGDKEFPTFNIRSPRQDYIYLEDSPFSKDEALLIEPSDAIVDNKHSKPAVVHPYYHQGHDYQSDFAMALGSKVPSKSTSHRDALPSYYQPSFSRNSDFQKPPIESSFAQTHKTSVRYPVTRGYKHLDAQAVRDTHVTEAIVTSDYKINDDSSWPLSGSDHNVQESKESLNSFSRTHLNQNNFTNSNDSHILIPSNSVFNYQHPPMISDSVNMSSLLKLNNENVESSLHRVPSSVINSEQADSPYDIYTTISPILERDTLQKNVANTPVLFETHSQSVFTNQLDTTESTVFYVENKTAYTPSNDFGANISDALPPVGNTKSDKMSSGAVAGIVIAVLVCFTVVTSAVIYIMYKRYNGTLPSVVESKFNSDNCGYLDDSLRSSVYLNNHIELPKENSEEMTSLDNDSFLNSLETMTIQNYWADNTKNTKV